MLLEEVRANAPEKCPMCDRPRENCAISLTLFELERKDIAYLEGACPQLAGVAQAGATAGRTATGLSPAEAAMATALATGSFDQVIKTYESMPLAPGRHEQGLRPW